ncbi:hypothetical protein [Paraburkholderia strydomiana]|nr:hypothetical protein [Paraburkholderia strydomiana]MBT2789456.1 hypothetical protein [Paraburkholderia strydomiana]
MRDTVSDFFNSIGRLLPVAAKHSIRRKSAVFAAGEYTEKVTEGGESHD